jgi:hypothetical protein
LLQAFFHGVIQLWLTHPEAFDLNAAARAMVETMLAGLVAAPPRRGCGGLTPGRRGRGRLTGSRNTRNCIDHSGDGNSGSRPAVL